MVVGRGGGTPSVELTHLHSATQRTIEELKFLLWSCQRPVSDSKKYTQLSINPNVRVTIYFDLAKPRGDHLGASYGVVLGAAS